MSNRTSVIMLVVGILLFSFAALAPEDPCADFDGDHEFVTETDANGEVIAARCVATTAR